VNKAAVVPLAGQNVSAKAASCWILAPPGSKLGLGERRTLTHRLYRLAAGGLEGLRVNLSESRQIAHPASLSYRITGEPVGEEPLAAVY
jgi:hypothetical protein